MSFIKNPLNIHPKLYSDYIIHTLSTILYYVHNIPLWRSCGHTCRCPWDVQPNHQDFSDIQLFCFYINTNSMLGNYFRVLYSNRTKYTYVSICEMCIHLRRADIQNICWLTSTTHFPEMLLAKRPGFELNR